MGESVAGNRGEGDGSALRRWRRWLTGWVYLHIGVRPVGQAVDDGDKRFLSRPILANGLCDQAARQGDVQVGTGP